MPGPVSTALVNNLTTQRDQLRQAATAALAAGDAGGRVGLPGPQELLRQAAILTGILAELTAIGA